MATLETSFHERYVAEAMQDPEFRQEYETERKRIEQIDAVVRSLDTLRAQAGLSKAELARRISKNPAVVRRLFSAQGNPELGTIAAIAIALGAEIKVVAVQPPQVQSRQRSQQRTA